MSKLLADKKKLFDIDKDNLMFHNKALFALLIPIVVEQLLNSFMGMVDTMMVSNLGSQAISGVSLVDSVNNLIVQLFSAMATGAAIICSHYIGMKDREGANKAARQVVLTVATIAVVITIAGLILRRPLLSFIFGKVEPEVMSNAVTYFLYTALSYPFLGDRFKFCVNVKN
ncbi:MAG: MATE family efflux transporter [Lachnospira pectinoschiza]